MPVINYSIPIDGPVIPPDRTNKRPVSEQEKQLSSLVSPLHAYTHRSLSQAKVRVLSAPSSVIHGFLVSPSNYGSVFIYGKKNDKPITGSNQRGSYLALLAHLSQFPANSIGQMYAQIGRQIYGRYNLVADAQEENERQELENRLRHEEVARKKAEAKTSAEKEQTEEKKAEAEIETETATPVNVTPAGAEKTPDRSYTWLHLDLLQLPNSVVTVIFLTLELGLKIFAGMLSQPMHHSFNYAADAVYDAQGIKTSVSLAARVLGSVGVFICALTTWPLSQAVFTCANLLQTSRQLLDSVASFFISGFAVIGDARRRKKNPDSQPTYGVIYPEFSHIGKVFVKSLALSIFGCIPFIYTPLHYLYSTCIAPSLKRREAQQQQRSENNKSSRPVKLPPSRQSSNRIPTRDIQLHTVTVTDAKTHDDSLNAYSRKTSDEAHKGGGARRLAPFQPTLGTFTDDEEAAPAANSNNRITSGLKAAANTSPATAPVREARRPSESGSSINADHQQYPSFSARGVTQRTQIMFGPPGYAYVYLIYGIYYCFNVVTEPKGNGAAVLVRALQPIRNISLRTEGPGLLCKAMQINKKLNGHDLLSDDFYIAETEAIEAFTIVKKPRIGVDYARHWAKRLLRFYIKNNKFVSRR